MDRRFTRTDYLAVVQLEYISSFVRHFVYTRPKDIKKYGDICRMKKEKIDNVAFKEQLRSIFSSNEVLIKYLKRIITDLGIPDFKYRDDEQKRKLEYWDKFYFFKRGSIIEFRSKLWTIDKNIVKSEIVEISNDDSEVVVVSYSQVKRVIVNDIISHFNKQNHEN